jgi:hypothetical protein
MIERVCVSAPSNVLTRAASCSDDDPTDNAQACVSSSQNYGMVRLQQDLRFALQQSKELFERTRKTDVVQGIALLLCKTGGRNEIVVLAGRGCHAGPSRDRAGAGMQGNQEPEHETCLL